jgi:hypothetical protein
MRPSSSTSRIRLLRATEQPYPDGISFAGVVWFRRRDDGYLSDTWDVGRRGARWCIARDYQRILSRAVLALRVSAMLALAAAIASSQLWIHSGPRPVARVDIGK